MRLALTLLLLAAGCHPVDDPLVPWPDPLQAAPAPPPVQTTTGHRVERLLTLLNTPQSVALDPAGNLYVAEDGLPGDPAAPPRVLRVSPAGHVDVLCEHLAAPIQRLRWHAGKLVVWHDGKVTCVAADGQRCPPPTGYDAEDYAPAFEIVSDARHGQVVRRRRDGAVIFAPMPDEEQRRPVSLAASADGHSVYIADHGPSGLTDAGVVWRITLDGQMPRGSPAGLSPPQQVGAPPGATRPSAFQKAF